MAIHWTATNIGKDAVVCYECKANIPQFHTVNMVQDSNCVPCPICSKCLPLYIEK